MRKLCWLIALLCAAPFASMNWAESVTANKALAFGTFAATSAKGGTVSIDPVTGSRTVSNVKGFLSTYSAAEFTIEGVVPGKAKDRKGYQLRSIDCGSGLTMGGGNPIPITFTSDTAGFISHQQIAFTNKSKSATVKIGGTAAVAANQPGGAYDCNLKMVVDFYD